MYLHLYNIDSTLVSQQTIIAILISTRYYMFMSETEQKTIAVLIERLGRIIAADEWGQEINPSQWTALHYLARANRFSRSPSNVSDYMTATRGTVSQTLKALARKDLISEVRSDHDKRSISYSVTDLGQERLQKSGVIDEALSSMNASEQSSLRQGLEALAGKALRQKKLKAFGVCKTCVHHRKMGRGGYCELLDKSLSAEEITQICHEHSELA